MSSAYNFNPRDSTPRESRVFDHLRSGVVTVYDLPIGNPQSDAKETSKCKQQY